MFKKKIYRVVLPKLHANKRCNIFYIKNILEKSEDLIIQEKLLKKLSKNIDSEVTQAMVYLAKTVKVGRDEINKLLLKRAEELSSNNKWSKEKIKSLEIFKDFIEAPTVQEFAITSLENYINFKNQWK